MAARGATVVTNPVSNLKLAVGRHVPVPRVRVSTGSRSGSAPTARRPTTASTSLQDVKVLALRAEVRAATTRPRCPPRKRGQSRPVQLAPALGARPLAVGEPADFLLVRAAAPELGPGHFLENLVYAASGSVVTTTVIAGNAVMRDGVVADEPEIRAKVVECARLGVL